LELAGILACKKSFNPQAGTPAFPCHRPRHSQPEGDAFNKADFIRKKKIVNAVALFPRVCVK